MYLIHFILIHSLKNPVCNLEEKSCEDRSDKGWEKLSRLWRWKYLQMDFLSVRSSRWKQKSKVRHVTRNYSEHPDAAGGSGKAFKIPLLQ